MKHVLDNMTETHHIISLLLKNVAEFVLEFASTFEYEASPCDGWSVCVCVCVCVCERERERSRQLLASDSGGVLFVTRTGLSPPPGVSITMIVMAMECEWQAGSHVVAGEQEARTAPVSDIILSFIKTLHSIITRPTHSLSCKISTIYVYFLPSVSHVVILLSPLFTYLSFTFHFIFNIFTSLPRIFGPIKLVCVCSWLFISVFVGLGSIVFCQGARVDAHVCVCFGERAQAFSASQQKRRSGFALRLRHSSLACCCCQ